MLIKNHRKVWYRSGRCKEGGLKVFVDFVNGRTNKKAMKKILWSFVNRRTNRQKLGIKFE